jgi:circadian clock protein KaiB
MEMQPIDLLTRKIGSMHHYEFTLFVNQRCGGGLRAIDSVEQVCQRHVKNDYKLTVIDIEDRPEEAERCYVLATPTLIVEHPLPKRRVIGCFTDHDELARLMGIVDLRDKLPAEPPRHSSDIEIDLGS